MKLTSAAAPRSDDFRANRAAQLAALAEIEAAASVALAGGGAEATARHAARGKLPPR